MSHPPSCFTTSTAAADQLYCWPPRDVLLQVHRWLDWLRSQGLFQMCFGKDFLIRFLFRIMTASKFSTRTPVTKPLQLTLTIAALRLPHTNSRVNKKQQNCSAKLTIILQFYFLEKHSHHWSISYMLFSIRPARVVRFSMEESLVGGLISGNFHPRMAVGRERSGGFCLRYLGGILDQSKPNERS